MAWSRFYPNLPYAGMPQQGGVFNDTVCSYHRFKSVAYKWNESQLSIVIYFVNAADIGLDNIRQNSNPFAFECLYSSLFQTFVW